MRRSLVVLILLAVAVPARANLLSNASFEDGDRLPAGWSTMVGARIGDAAIESVVALDASSAHDGDRSLHLSGHGDVAIWNAIISEPVAIEAGANYVVSGWMRTLSVRQESGQYQNSNLFVQFLDAAGVVVRSGKYPVVALPPLMGDHDWAQQQRTIQAPAGATRARVACFLSCSGDAWFDDVSFTRVNPARWQEHATKRFVFHWEPEDGGAVPALALERNLSILQELEWTLETHATDPIHFYKYASKTRKGELTGSTGNGHVENGREIHSVFWVQGHEIVHVVMADWTGGTALLGEGIAVHLSGGWQGKPVDEVVRALDEEKHLLPLATLASTRDFRAHDESTTYPQAGSFARWLLSRADVATLKQLYESTSPEQDGAGFDTALQKIYGLSLAEAEAQWKRDVLETSPR